MNNNDRIVELEAQLSVSKAMINNANIQINELRTELDTCKNLRFSLSEEYNNACNLLKEEQEGTDKQRRVIMDLSEQLYVLQSKFEEAMAEIEYFVWYDHISYTERWHHSVETLKKLKDKEGMKYELR